MAEKTGEDQRQTTLGDRFPDEELLKRIERLEKERPRSARDLLQGTGSPFIKEILKESFPKDFKLPSIGQYNGSSDPFGHIDTYHTVMSTKHVSENIMCRVFPLTLVDAARDWFYCLEAESIFNFQKLKEDFLVRFSMVRARQEKATYLQTIKQESYEDLRTYLDRFIKATHKVDNFTDNEVVVALRDGLQEGPLLDSAAGRLPRTLQEFLDRAQEFISAEEYHSTRKRKLEEAVDVQIKEEVHETVNEYETPIADELKEGHESNS